MNDKIKQAQFLVYAGMLPFLATGIVPFFDPSLFSLDYQKLALTYGAVIASFIAGIHWGLYLYKNAPVNLFIHSNIITLMAWLSNLLPMVFGVFLLFVCFIYLLLIDLRLFENKTHEQWFIRLRKEATVIVLLTLLLNLLHAFF